MKYSLLSNGDTAQYSPNESRNGQHSPILIISIAVNVLFGVFTMVGLSNYYTATERSPAYIESPSAYAKVDPLSTSWKQFWWDTPYGSTNRSESDPLWEAILPSHGFVAMDRDWATENHWPVSMYLPSDKSKGVYLLEAYHQLHCLRILRKTFWEAVDGRTYTYNPGHHVSYCFDTLRQAVQCNADSTPLYTFGDKTAGDGQIHKCRDWNELREFATNNTACYRDSVHDIKLGEHFGYCDDGNDGIIV